MNPLDFLISLTCRTLLGVFLVAFVIVTLVIVISAIDPDGWQQALDEAREEYRADMEERRQAERLRRWKDRG